MTRIVIAEDEALVREGLVAIVSSHPDYEVVATAADGVEAVASVRRTDPDVVLMDIRMPGVDGLEATRRIVADPETSGTRILVLTTFELDEYVFEALRVGASGFLVKDTEPADLVKAVRAVAAGDAQLSPSVTRRLIEHVAVGAKPLPHERPDVARLTQREREIVTLVGEGLSNAEIAHRLVVSPATAKTHVSRAMVKLGVRDRAQLVVLAYESGLVRPGWLD
jgi:DNA-binding NarL/FixJ family response regulator